MNIILFSNGNHIGAHRSINGGGTYLHYYVSGAVTHPASLVPQIMPLPLGVGFSSWRSVQRNYCSAFRWVEDGFSTFAAIFVYYLSSIGDDEFEQLRSFQRYRNTRQAQHAAPSSWASYKAISCATTSLASVYLRKLLGSILLLLYGACIARLDDSSCSCVHDGGQLRVQSRLQLVAL